MEHSFERKVQKAPPKPPTRQLWKVNDERAQKNGNCQAVYWVKEREVSEEKLKHGPRADKDTREWKTGNVYKGEWQSNKKHGYGIQIWASGNKYEGDWADGCREGHGVFWIMQKNGKLRKLYAGNWKKGLKDGLGVFYYKDKARYEGHWKDGMRQGQGTLFSANGDVYVGNWHLDKQSGFGTLTLANNDVYEGEWLNGQREGPGIFYFKSKEKIYDGEWVNDIPKCGVYVDAAEFFLDDSGNTAESANAETPRPPRLANKLRPLPRLRLVDAEGVLADRIETIQKERQAVRNLPFIQLDQLFGEEGLDDLRRLFSTSDSEGHGTVTASGLRGLLRELGFTVTEPQLAQLMLDLDKNASAALNFSDFVKAVHLIGERFPNSSQPHPKEEASHSS